jgi:DNA-binding Lrp family transcriptional regulator
MVEAYVLVQSEAGQAGRVTEDLRKIPGVTSVETVTGPYDVVIRIEADDVDLLGKLVVGHLHNVDGIVRTLTCPIASL